MGPIKKVLSIAALMGIVCPSTHIMAQTTTRVPDEVLTFDGGTQDFVLPSYFDAIPVAGPQEFVADTQDDAPQEIPSDVDILQEIFGEDAPSTTPAPAEKPVGTIPAPVSSQTFYPHPQMEEPEVTHQPLLTALPPLPAMREEKIVPHVRSIPAQTYSTKVLANESGKSKAGITLPKDVRLQFRPGSSQISQANIKWVTAYAIHVQKDPRLVVEIRVSRNDWAVQQARLKLIAQILMQKGLSSRQIKVYQSDRDPDTLVLGYGLGPDQTKIIVPDEVPIKIKEQKTLSW